MRIGLLRRFLSGVILSSILLTSCEIEFTPDVIPLELETVPEQPFKEPMPESEQELSELSTEEAVPEGNAKPEFDSSDAIELCGNDLTWGNKTMGACLAPGGNSYYIWKSPTDIYLVPVNPNDPDQVGFLQAVIGRNGATASMQKGARTGGWSVAALFVTVVGFPFACMFGTVVGCIVDGGAILVAGGLLYDAGSDFIEDWDTFQSHSAQAEYYICKLQGYSDPFCRDSAGITSEQLGGRNE